MATFETIEEARDFFKGDKFATNIGVTLDELEEDSCVCSLELCDDFKCLWCCHGRCNIHPW